MKQNDYDKYPFWELNREEEIKQLKSIKMFLGIITPSEMKEWIIDVGCGTGRNLLYLELNGKKDLVGIDLSKVSVRKANSKLKHSKVVQADATNLSIFKDNSFNTVVCHGVAHHTLNPRKVFLECRRILNKGGTLLFSYYRKYSFYYWDYKYLKKFMRKRLENKNYGFMKLWMVITKQARGLSNDQAIRRFADRYNYQVDFKTEMEINYWIEFYNLRKINSIITNKGNLNIFRIEK